MQVHKCFSLRRSLGAPQPALPYMQVGVLLPARSTHPLSVLQKISSFHRNRNSVRGFTAFIVGDGSPQVQHVCHASKSSVDIVEVLGRVGAAQGLTAG